LPGGFRGHCQATPISVTNFSFENPATPEGDYGGSPSGLVPADSFPGWSSSGGNGVQNFGPGSFPGSDDSQGTLSAPADGLNVVYINGTYVYQDVGLLLPNTTYTLNVAAGNQPGYGPGSTGHIALINGTNTGGATLANSFANFSTTFTTGSTVSGDLTIALIKDSGNQILYDNVRLDATAVPEPGLLLLFGIAAASLLVGIRRRA